MNGPLFFLVVDALRNDYLSAENSPFLWSQTRLGTYVRRIRPSFGFCEIAEVCTGTSPANNGFFCQVGFQPDRRVSLPLRLATGLLDPIERRTRGYAHEVCRSVLRRLARRFDEREIYEVPAHALRVFHATEGDRDYDGPMAFGVESIFDVLREAGLDWDISEFVYRNRIEGTDADRTDRLVERAEAADPLPALTMAYLGEMDASGHKNGPLSPGLLETLRATDERVRRLVGAYRARGANVIVLGDHGMVAVEGQVDVLAAVRAAVAENGWVEGRDVLFFVDSTLLRVWFPNSKTAQAVRVAVRDALEALGPDGYFLEGARARGQGVPEDDPRYGDLAYAAEPGVLFWPDFFNKAPVRGMHGYPTHIDGQKGFALGLGPSFPPGLVEEADLFDLAPTATARLGLRAPAHSEGEDLVAQAEATRRSEPCTTSGS